jgi:hypothetical protein
VNCTVPTALPVVADRDGMAVIGRTRHALMGLRYENGEGGAGAGGPAAAAGQADAAAAAAAAAAGAAGAGAPPAADAPWTKDNFDPERAWSLLQNVRSDLDKAKTGKTAAEQKAQESADRFEQFTKGLGGLLGFEQQETDPAKLQEKVTDLSSQVQAKDGDLTKAQADIKARDLTIAVLQSPAARDANTALLLANEQFKTSIASAEPTDGAAITAAITKALQDNAALKATPSRSGGGEHQGATVQSLEAQLATATEKRDFKETIRLKQAIAAARQRAAQG